MLHNIVEEPHVERHRQLRCTSKVNNEATAYVLGECTMRTGSMLAESLLPHYTLTFFVYFVVFVETWSCRVSVKLGIPPKGE